MSIPVSFQDSKCPSLPVSFRVCTSISVTFQDLKPIPVSFQDFTSIPASFQGSKCPLLCSRGMAGALTPQLLDEKVDVNGTTFLEAANAASYGGTSHQACCFSFKLTC